MKISRAAESFSISIDELPYDYDAYLLHKQEYQLPRLDQEESRETKITNQLLYIINFFQSSIVHIIIYPVTESLPFVFINSLESQSK